MRTHPPIEAGESQVGLQWSLAAVVQQKLSVAALDEGSRGELYLSLLESQVYVEGLEILLCEDGPQLELRCRMTDAGPLARVFSSRSRAGMDGRTEVERTAFVHLLHLLPEGAGLTLDAHNESLVISAEHAAELRALAPLQHH